MVKRFYSVLKIDTRLTALLMYWVIFFASVFDDSSLYAQIKSI